MEMFREGLICTLLCPWPKCSPGEGCTALGAGDAAVSKTGRASAVYRAHDPQGQGALDKSSKERHTVLWVCFLGWFYLI